MGPVNGVNGEWGQTLNSEWGQTLNSELVL
jgi:hypothetical protein